MADARRWMKLDELLALNFESSAEIRQVHDEIVVIEGMIEAASLVLSKLAMQRDGRRLAGAALSAQSPAELRDVLTALLMKLPTVE